MRMVMKYVGPIEAITECEQRPVKASIRCEDGSCPGKVHGECPFYIDGELTDGAKPLFLYVMEETNVRQRSSSRREDSSSR